MKAVTKWFNDEKGFGFVVLEDGQEAFVHHSTIQSDGYRSLAEGEEVDVEVEQGPKGLKATSVVKL
jgi:cold shock protein